MAKKEAIEVEGTVVEALPNAMFRLSWPTATRSSLTLVARCGCISSEAPGDRVLVELSPYDLTRGRVTFRFH